MTKGTAEFLLAMLGNITLNVGADDFDEAVKDVLEARKELQAVVAGES